jgi:hypothetical protein
VVLAGDVEEYARIMRAFIDGVVDYQTLSNNCLKQWQKVTPEAMGNAQLNIYKELLE